MMEMLRRIAGIAREGGRGALAGIVSASGSLPMSRRSCMLVLADGTQHGTVGGGCLEAEVHAMSAGVIRGGEAVLSRFTLTESRAGAEGLNCGGTVRILVRPVGAGESAAVYRAALEAMERSEETVIVTALSGTSGGEAPWVSREDGVRPVRILGTGLVGWSGHRAGCGGMEAGAPARVLDAAQELLGAERSAFLEGDGTRESGGYFLESLALAPVLYLFGAGHVGRAVAGVASAAGFRVVVVDDRPEFACADRFPEADSTEVMPLRGAIGRLPIDARSFILAVTRGHQHDEPIIEEALRTPARYIGMIGSQRKKAILWNRLKGRGLANDALARVHCPVGLPIGADSPGEIAVSIVAEMIRVRRRGADARPVPTASGAKTAHVPTTVEG